ncbi:prepilin peptidase [Amycolatopsis sp. 195334CR]|uniref:prepilin peptidase n=1 Tax=Amycolatopsis sp. 195334CR TaxID=2814588 RepID=UPI001A8FE3E3|nr:prepilin peptidase [Amycolatopsis sp. 195334CR]MBN6034168.1 prepilin peptidase [Amycolatopsis sp. 195334CR]
MVLLLGLAAVVGAGMSAVTRRLLTDPSTGWWSSPGTGAAGTAGLITAPALNLGWDYELVVFLVAALFSVPLVVLDLLEHRLPSALIRPLACLTAALLAIAAWERADGTSALRAMMAAVVVTLLLLLLAVATGGVGAGDVKLGGVIGLLSGWFSWPSVALTMFAATASAAVLLGLRAAICRSPSVSSVAFGPFLVGGLFGSLLWP